jgi:hypothetical protein
VSQSEVPWEFARLAGTLERVKAELRRSGVKTEITVKTAAELSRQAFDAWRTDGGEGTNQLRVIANIIHGLAHAYSPRPNWLKATLGGSINIDENTTAPRTSNLTLRLYALASANVVIYLMLAHRRGDPLEAAAWEHACVAQDYFDSINSNGIEHWKGAVYAALAYLGQRNKRLDESRIREYAEVAWRHLDRSTDLYYLAARLAGRGDGFVPFSGWFGSNFRRRRGWFTIYDLYHFKNG